MTVDAVFYPPLRSTRPRADSRSRFPRRVGPRARAAAASILDEAAALDRLHATMVALARTWFRLQPHDAEDVVQSAFATFLEVRDRFAAADEYPAILVGILRNKCHEHVRRSSGERRSLQTYCVSADAARENPWIRPRAPAQAPSVIDELERREMTHEIRRCLARLSPNSSQIISLVVDRGFGRQDLIHHFGVNPNTLDTRLRSSRGELRRLLTQGGIAG